MQSAHRRSRRQRGTCCHSVRNSAIGCTSATMMDAGSCAWVHSDNHAMNTSASPSQKRANNSCGQIPILQEILQIPKYRKLCISCADGNKHGIQSGRFAEERWIVPLAKLDPLPVVSNPTWTSSLWWVSVFGAQQIQETLGTLSESIGVARLSKGNMYATGACQPQKKTLERIPVTL